MAERKLKIAADLSLPADLVTESIAVLAIKGAGKSTLARRIVEQIFYANQQCVIVDPKGDWWGLLYGKDGKSPGLPFIVLGGEHAHIPLESGTGPHAIEKNAELIARLAAIERVSIVLDLSTFRKHEMARFMTFFMETLYRLKAKDEYRTPMMLAMDEADAIVPQKVVKSEGGIEPRMLGAAEDIVRRGRQRGIGSMLISQRAAVINKNVLTQCPLLFALRTSGTQDIDAIKEWLDANFAQLPPADRRAISDVIPQFVNGEGWALSSSIPLPPGTRLRTQFLMPDTFDSSATPKAGQQRIVPKNAADVDLEAFKREMATTIQKAKAEDPKELRRRIAELEKTQPADDRAITAAMQKQQDTIDGLRAENKQLTGMVRELTKRNADLLGYLKKISGSVVEAIAKLDFKDWSPPATTPGVKPEYAVAAGTNREPLVTRPAPMHLRKPLVTTGYIARGQVTVRTSSDLTKMQRSMLIALAQHPEGLTKAQVLLHTGYASSGSTSDAFAELNRNGWTTTTLNFVTITDAGRTALGEYEPLPHGDELRQFLLSGNKLVQELRRQALLVPYTEESKDAVQPEE